VTSALITGAAGHIGRRLVRRFTTDGIVVRALVRTPTGGWPDGVHELVGDLARGKDLARVAAEGVDVVVHLAGASEAAIRRQPETSKAESVAAAAAVAKSGAARLLYLSTVHVYGSALAPGAVVSELTAPQPLSDYAQARKLCEDVLRESGQPTVVFRLTNGLGAPLQREQSGWDVVSNELCRSGVTQGCLTLRSPGTQWRDFVPLIDIEAVLSAMVRGQGPNDGLYNFGSGETITVRELAFEIQDSIERVVGTRPTLSIPPAQAEDDLGAPYRMDVSQLAALELFTPTPRSEAIDGVVGECLRRRSELSG
jgi:nucleoside-diphosphate-sugar epimerase